MLTMISSGNGSARRPSRSTRSAAGSDGPMPRRPIRPVAKWQLRIALTLSVPEEDWFTPSLKTVTTFSVAIQRAQNASIRAVANPVSARSR